MEYSIKYQKSCRACNSIDIETVLPLRSMPPGDKYAESAETAATTLLPSDIQMCNACGHIQMSGFTDSKYIYGNYLSRPASTNSNLAKAYQDYAVELKELADGGSLLEVGSNDGLFLHFLQNINQKAVGIDPAKNLCQLAAERGVQTIEGFVSTETVEQALASLGNSPSVILANHSFSNVENICDWASLLSGALIENGYLVIQSFYQIDVLRKKMLENYNHEHLTYMTIDNSSRFMARYGMKLAKVKLLDAKGGSIRLYFKKTNINPELDESTLLHIRNENAILPDIRKLFVDTLEYIQNSKKSIHKYLEGDSITLAAYGTSIGATVFSYQFELDKHIKVFFDDDPYRQNLYSPGSAALVMPGQSRQMNEYKKCIVLAPLYADKIIANNQEYIANGGVFIKFWPKVSEVK